MKSFQMLCKTSTVRHWQQSFYLLSTLPVRPINTSTEQCKYNHIYNATGEWPHSRSNVGEVGRHMEPRTIPIQQRVYKCTRLSIYSNCIITQTNQIYDDRLLCSNLNAFTSTYLPPLLWLRRVCGMMNTNMGPVYNVMMMMTMLRVRRPEEWRSLGEFAVLRCAMMICGATTSHDDVTVPSLDHRTLLHSDAALLENCGWFVVGVGFTHHQSMDVYGCDMRYAPIWCVC